MNIEAGAYPPFQLHRYAWSADLPISILTDFEEYRFISCMSFYGIWPINSKKMRARYGH
jgi:hypothetical protein